MGTEERKVHWQKVYTRNELHEVGWYQPIPQTSLDLIDEIGLDKSKSIIDIGGGDSFLTEHLMELGYSELSVLDISDRAIERAKERMGAASEKVNWIESDIVDFKIDRKYDLWHDRAAFHFLRSDEDIESYMRILSEAVNPGGHAVIGTFSENGPLKCSGRDIVRYTVSDLSGLMQSNFELIDSMNIDHETPNKTIQNFNFCIFKKK